jgi:putative transposase
MTSAMPQGQVTIERLCRLARVSRAGYYRFWQTSAPRQHDTAARDTIQRLVLANGRYRRGYRYITQQLRRDGLIVNHKRVLRLMREDNLLGLRRRPFVPLTTDRRHPWPVVPNRARDMQLSGLDQLWVADITPAFAGAGSPSGCRRNSPIWQSSAMPSAAASSAGRWPIISAPVWRWRR